MCCVPLSSEGRCHDHDGNTHTALVESKREEKEQKDKRREWNQSSRTPKLTSFGTENKSSSMTENISGSHRIWCRVTQQFVGWSNNQLDDPSARGGEQKKKEVGRRHALLGRTGKRRRRRAERLRSFFGFTGALGSTMTVAYRRAARVEPTLCVRLSVRATYRLNETNKLQVDYLNSKFLVLCGCPHRRIKPSS